VFLFLGGGGRGACILCHCVLFAGFGITLFVSYLLASRCFTQFGLDRSEAVCVSVCVCVCVCVSVCLCVCVCV